MISLTCRCNNEVKWPGSDQLIVTKGVRKLYYSDATIPSDLALRIRWTAEIKTSYSNSYEEIYILVSMFAESPEYLRRLTGWRQYFKEVYLVVPSMRKPRQRK